MEDPIKTFPNCVLLRRRGYRKKRWTNPVFFPCFTLPSSGAVEGEARYPSPHVATTAVPVLGAAVHVWLRRSRSGSDQDAQGGAFSTGFLFSWRPLPSAD